MPNMVQGTQDMQALSNFIGASGNTSSQNASLWQGLGNLFTGNLDYARNLDTMNLTNAFNAAEAEKARQFSSKEAEIARNWEEMMSNSAYQRQASDLKAAGYNPALVLGAGGASTPSAAAAHTSQASAGYGYRGSRAGQGFELIASAIIGLLSRGFASGVAASAYSERTHEQAEASRRHAAAEYYRTDQWKYSNRYAVPGSAATRNQVDQEIAEILEKQRRRGY